MFQFSNKMTDADFERVRNDIVENYYSKRNLRTFGRRLLKLRDYLKTLPARQYNHALIVTRFNVHPCKSVECAFGHAVHSGIFHGLRQLKMTEDGILFRGNNWNGYIDNEEEAEKFFGPSTWSKIFGGFAWRESPSKAEVIHRMTEYADKVFGVK